jgi:hypothetical protein
MVVIDATILMLLYQPDAGVPVGPGKVPVDRPADRIAFLVQRLQKTKTRIIIPTPVLSEVLVRAEAGAAQQFVERIGNSAIFRIEPFDARAAIEVALMTRNAIDGGRHPRRRDPQATWAKLKYDRQVVAIAKVAKATAIYSDDGDIRAIAKREGIPVIGLLDLPLPSEDPQLDLDFAAPNNVPEEPTAEEVAHEIGESDKAPPR